MFESESTEDLKARVLRMSEYYLKGMGNAILDGIPTYAFQFGQGKQDRDYLGLAVGAYEMMADLYARIPFDELENDEAFAPLFLVRDLIPRFKEQMDLAFSEPSRENREALVDTATEISIQGYDYWTTMINMLHQVRNERGEKDFYIHLVDVVGREWTF